MPDTLAENVIDHNQALVSDNSRGTFSWGYKVDLVNM